MKPSVAVVFQMMLDTMAKATSKQDLDTLDSFLGGLLTGAVAYNDITHTEHRAACGRQAEAYERAVVKWQ